MAVAPATPSPPRHRRAAGVDEDGDPGAARGPGHGQAVRSRPATSSGGRRAGQWSDLTQGLTQGLTQRGRIRTRGRSLPDDRFPGGSDQPTPAPLRGPAGPGPQDSLGAAPGAPWTWVAGAPCRPAQVRLELVVGRVVLSLDVVGDVDQQPVQLGADRVDVGSSAPGTQALSRAAARRARAPARAPRAAKAPRGRCRTRQPVRRDRGHPLTDAPAPLLVGGSGSAGVLRTCARPCNAPVIPG